MAQQVKMLRQPNLAPESPLPTLVTALEGRETDSEDQPLASIPRLVCAHTDTKQISKT